MTRGLTMGAFVAAAALSAGVPTILARQTPPQRDPQRDVRASAPGVAATTGTGALGGTVTNGDGSRPVRYAFVVLVGATTGVSKASSTDQDGKFAFTNLPADRYMVGASKPPYIGTVAGSRRPAHAGTPIALADGQKIANVAIRMPMGAAITGVILDEKGQPSPTVSVMVWQWRLQNGERTLVSTGTSVLTDDRGRYRVYGLVPGEYLVSANKQALVPSPRLLSAAEVDASLRAGAAPPGQSPSLTNSVRYAPVYFPGTVRASDAVSLALGAGDERGGVDFKLEATRTVVLSGSITAADGQMPPRLAVSMSPMGPAINQSTYSVSLQPDGTFAFLNVMPGTYVVRATGGPPPGAPSGPMLQAASAIVEVSAADVGGVQLVLRPGATIAGTLVFRGAAAPPPFLGWRLPIRVMGPSLLQPPYVGPATDTGSFTIMNVFSGSLMIGAQSPDATWTLESVNVDGRDMTDVPVEISVDNVPQNLSVTFTDRWQELSGRLTRAGGAPASEYTVVVFPEDKKYWIPGSRRILTARPGTDGKFILSAAGPNTLPAGKYLIAAVTDLERDEQYDPAVLSALATGGVPVTLQAGDKKIQDLMVK